MSVTSEPREGDQGYTLQGDHDNDHGHGLLQHHFDDLDQQRESITLGMWSFLATEVMMFGGLFFVYSLYRWLFHDAYVTGSRHLNITYGTINTFVLLFSSLTMALAVQAAQKRNRKKLVAYLAITWVFGAAFLGIKAVEWVHDYHIGLIPGVRWEPHLAGIGPVETAQAATASQNPINDPTRPGTSVPGDSTHSFNTIATNQLQMFFVVYFCMTGLHAIHMIVGLLMVAVWMYMGARGRFTNGNDQPVELLGLYWHLVDIIWVFLFPLLYLIGGFHPFGGGGH